MSAAAICSLCAPALAFAQSYLDSRTFQERQREHADHLRRASAYRAWASIQSTPVFQVTAPPAEPDFYALSLQAQRLGAALRRLESEPKRTEVRTTPR